MTTSEIRMLLAAIERLEAKLDAIFERLALPTDTEGRDR